MNEVLHRSPPSPSPKLPAMKGPEEERVAGTKCKSLFLPAPRCPGKKKRKKHTTGTHTQEKVLGLAQFCLLPSHDAGGKKKKFTT